MRLPIVLLSWVLSKRKILSEMCHFLYEWKVLSFCYRVIYLIFVSVSDFFFWYALLQLVYRANAKPPPPPGGNKTRKKTKGQQMKVLNCVRKVDWAFEVAIVNGMKRTRTNKLRKEERKMQFQCKLQTWFYYVCQHRMKFLNGWVTRLLTMIFIPQWER